MIRGYEDLRVWQKSKQFVKEIYLQTENFPSKEKYRLVDQLCRAAISVPANIAEGCSWRSTREYIRFVNIAYASLCECETHLHIACDLGYLKKEDLRQMLDMSSEIAKMLNALYTSLSEKLKTTGYRIPDTEYS